MQVFLAMPESGKKQKCIVGQQKGACTEAHERGSPV